MILSLVSTNLKDAIDLISNDIIPLVVNKEEEIDESKYPFYIDMGNYYRYDFIFVDKISKNEITKVLVNDDVFNIDNIYEKDNDVIIEANSNHIDINSIINNLI